MARKKFSSIFKAKVALEAIQGDSTMAELSQKHNVHQTQIKETQAYFLLNFYHLSEYLHEAALCLSPKDPEAWASVHKKHMKEGNINTAIQELERHINEEKKVENHICEAKNCYNYMIRRLQQFDYKDAIVKNLPIGSGKIESGHRSVIQKRLKIS